MNMQEQSVLFMASLWLMAVFVSPDDATDLGTAYLILRSTYPVVSRESFRHVRGIL